MRICFVQFGDYREAVYTFARGGEESYYAQAYSVNFVAGLVHLMEQVTVISVDAPRYDQTLPTTVRTIGLPLWRGATDDELVELVAKVAPTHLVVRFPHVPLLRHGIRHALATLPLLADSFPRRGLRQRWRNHQLARALNHPGIAWVANHNINASRSLEAIGVRPDKIVPWDWPPMVRPDNYPPKKALPEGSALRLFYVGHLSTEKGLGDCIEALDLLRHTGIDASLTVAGAQGDPDTFREMAQRIGVQDAVRFLGRIPHNQVVPLMHEHDAVLVPSRHAYPEGLPMTIYEALCARTPLLVSDHPMFAGKVIHETSALVFRAGDPHALADQALRLARDPGLYEHLSSESASAWQALQCPVTWGELLTRWIRNTENDHQWFATHSLAGARR